MLKNPDDFLNAFDNYVANANSIWKNLEAALSSSDRGESQNTIRAFMDFRDRFFATISSFLNSPELVPSILISKIQEWDSLIAENDNLSDIAKFILFPPYQYPGYEWSLDSVNGTIEPSGNPLFGSPLKFFNIDLKQERSLKKVVNGLSLVRSAFDDPVDLWKHYHPGNYIHNARYINAGSWIFNVKGFSTWLVKTIRKMELSSSEAYEILLDKNYWELKKRGKTARTGTFYDNPEYLVNPVLAQDLQTYLYSKLKNNFTNIDREYQYWYAFAGRGITSFTDAWALKIATEAKDQKNIGLIEKLYSSYRIWNLETRLSLAVIYYNHSSMIQRLIRIGAGSRDLELKTLLSHIALRFPEMSVEKERLINRLANHLQCNKLETNYLFEVGTKSAIKSDRYSSSKIKVEEGLGIRVYSLLIAELFEMAIEERTEYLDFILGHSEIVPKKLKNDGSDLKALAATSRESLANGDDESVFPYIATVIGPFQFRKLFQSLPVKSRTGLLNPLMEGEDRGLPFQKEGREWLMKTLVPANSTWGQMAVDLVDGYVEALNVLGQRHLSSLFLSYLLAASVKLGQGEFDQILGTQLSLSDTESPEGRILRIVFQSTVALMKIGQKLHSTHVLPPHINVSLEGLKQEGDSINRDIFFSWLESSANCTDICTQINLDQPLGDASVKVHFSGTALGQEIVIGLVRPNAKRKGDTQFKIVEYAVKFAIEKGHNMLKVILPIIERSRTTLKLEVNMDEERKSMVVFKKIYRNKRKYGGGNVQFFTPDINIKVDQLLKSDRGYVVGKIEVKRFSDLEPIQQQDFAQAVVEKEIELLFGDHEYIIFDKDRHEGNFLWIVDELYLRERSVKTGILAIDAGQISKIHSGKRDVILDVVTIIAAEKVNLVATDQAVASLVEKFNENLVRGTKITQRDLKEIKTILNHHDKNIFSVLSEIMAKIQSRDGTMIDESSWDFVIALQTLVSWDVNLGEGKNVSGRISKIIESRMKKYIGVKGVCSMYLRRTRSWLDIGK